MLWNTRILFVGHSFSLSRENSSSVVHLSRGRAARRKQPLSFRGAREAITLPKSTGPLRTYELKRPARHSPSSVCMLCGNHSKRERKKEGFSFFPLCVQANAAMRGRRGRKESTMRETTEKEKEKRKMAKTRTKAAIGEGGNDCSSTCVRVRMPWASLEESAHGILSFFSAGQNEQQRRQAVSLSS